MKLIIKHSIILILCMFIPVHGIAQQIASHLLSADSLSVSSEKEESPLNKAKINSYWLTVTYDKTTHLIFPCTIRYVDLGSEYLSAGKAEGMDNVLRIKASVRNFEPETNFSVITEDGKFYNFDVFYSSAPAVLNYDMVKMQLPEKENKTDTAVLFEELDQYSTPVVESIFKMIYYKNERAMKSIYSKDYGIALSLKGIYVHKGKFYFHMDFQNNSNLPFSIDFITFRIVNKKTARKAILQDQSLTPLRIYKTLNKVAEKSKSRNIFMLDQFSMTGDQILIIEVYEKDGRRHQLLKVKNRYLSQAEIIENIL